jgi:hypothetical protein
MSVRNKIVPPAITSVVPDPSPLQLCLAAAAKDDEMAMQLLGRRVRATYIAVRLNQLAVLELEHGEWHDRNRIGAFVSEQWS